MRRACAALFFKTQSDCFLSKSHLCTITKFDCVTPSRKFKNCFFILICLRKRGPRSGLSRLLPARQTILCCLAGETHHAFQQHRPRTDPSGRHRLCRTYLGTKPFHLSRSPNPLAWTSAGNGASDNHDAPFEFILGPTTAASLSTRWVFTANGEVQGTPTVEGNAVYASDTGGSVWRIDAHSGKAVWEVKMPTLSGNSASYSRVSPAVGQDTIIVGDQASATLYALSKRTGELRWKTTVSATAFAFITGSPVIVNGRVYVGVSSNQEYAVTTVPNFQLDFRGSVVALDLKTGKLLWQTYTVPQGYTGGAVWSGNVAVDTLRQAVYVDTGNNYSVPGAVAACQTNATTPSQLGACLDPNDHIDSVLALDINSGSVKWADRFVDADTTVDSCLPRFPNPGNGPCPQPSGPDFDFGASPNLFTIDSNGHRRDLVGAGQKSGVYWALDRDSGSIVWSTQIGTGGRYGGIEYGTATDGKRIYIPAGNFNYVETNLISGQKTNGGYWSALDPATGKILWQTPTPALAVDDSVYKGSPLAPPPGAFAGTYGSVSVANGVMYGEDQAGNFLALDAETGNILFNFQSGGTSISGPAIAGGTLYWSSGYRILGATNNKIYALAPWAHPVKSDQ